MEARNLKNILVTGACGQLGRALARALPAEDYALTLTDLHSEPQSAVQALDLADAQAVNSFLSGKSFDYVVNCAAFTAVDAAESHPEECRRANVLAVSNLAKAVSLTPEAKLIQISTDYVFPGTASRPYETDDATGPQSVYGATKLEGEKAALEALPERCVVVRTAWLYSPCGNNFVRTMLRLGTERDTLKVVNDQIGTPTSADSLALALKKVIDAETFIPGIYHYTDAGTASWYEFACTIHEMAGIKNCTISPCTTEEYPTAAVRPAYSVLSKKKISTDYGVQPPHWRESLRKCLLTILNRQ